MTSAAAEEEEAEEAQVEKAEGLSQQKQLFSHDEIAYEIDAKTQTDVNFVALTAGDGNDAARKRGRPTFF